MRPRTIAVLGATAAAVAASGFFLFSEIDRRWKELDKRADALQRRLLAAEGIRPVLYGTAIQADAWTAYESALSLARADKALEESVRPRAYSSLAPEERERLLAAHAGTLDQLRRGAHCVEARNDIDWSWGFFSAEGQSALTTRALANLAIAQSQARIETGRYVEAVETLLDAAQLGRDLMHSHMLIDEMIGASVLGTSTFWVTEYNQLLDRLSPEALERFAEGLAILDGSIAEVGPSHQSEAVLFVRSLQGDPGQEQKERWSRDAWRYGFSNRLKLATIGLNRLDLADRVVATAGEGWPACESNFSRDCNADPAAANLRTALVTRFHTIARLRLLRMAVHHKLGHTVPELTDPFGKTLQHTMDDEGRARFWSAGPEGQDDLFLFSQSGS